MSDQFDQFPRRVQRHLESIVEHSGLPPGQESLDTLKEVWQRKVMLFREQTEALDMVLVEGIGPAESKGALLLTYSGSLITLSPSRDRGRRLEYASIELRQDVPALLQEEGITLAEPLERDKPGRFSGGSIAASSQLLLIATFQGDLPPAEQEQRLREATIFLTNGFVRENMTLSVDRPEGIEHFTMKRMVSQIAERTSTTQKLARQIIDEYLDLIETGALLGERVSLGRIGRLQLTPRAARKARVGRNPATGEEMVIPAKPEAPVPKLTFSKPFRDRAALVPPSRLTEDR